MGTSITMADTTSPLLQLLIMDPTAASHTNDWGIQTSNNLVKLENADAGVTALTITGGTLTLTADQQRSALLVFTGLLASPQIVTVAATSKGWTIVNATTGAFSLTMTVSGGGSVSVPQGYTSEVVTDGNNIYNSFLQPLLGVTSGVDAAPGVVRGPGVEDFDISLFKNFPWGEKRSVQFRVETFNTFNHPQFNSVDTNPQFDQTGAQVNGRLGQIISDYLPRQVQLALKLIF